MRHIVTAVAMLAAVAIIPFAQPSSAEDAAVAPATTPLLGQMKTFEADIFQGPDSLETPLYPREIANYVNKHLQKDSQLRFDSPADGVIHMECKGVNCYMIRATVTVGQNGPVVWEDNQATGKAGLPCYKSMIFPCPLKDERKVADEIVEKLSRAHKLAVQSQTNVNYTSTETPDTK